MMKPIPPIFYVCAIGALAVTFIGLAYFRPDPHARLVTATATEPPVAEPAPVIKLPSLTELFDTGTFAPLKPKGEKLSSPAAIDPPIPAPLATVAAAEASAPQGPSPCEVAARRLAWSTRAPIRDSILDDIEAKYELIRVSDNQRFLAIRSACVKGHPKRG